MDVKNFSLVSYLTNEEFNSVLNLQTQISEITHSVKSLTEWLPHITVGDGIAVSSEQLEEVENILKKFTENQKNFTTYISGFGGTETWKGAVPGKITPYVIWLDVEMNGELMSLFTDLKNSLTSHYDAWLPRTVNYSPHVTLAFADLTEEGYKKGLEFIKNQKFESPLTISHVALVECFGEGNMTSKEYKRFNFKE